MKGRSWRRCSVDLRLRLYHVWLFPDRLDQMTYRMTAEACCSSLQIAYHLGHVPQQKKVQLEDLGSLEKAQMAHHGVLKGAILGLEGMELEEKDCQIQCWKIPGEPSTYQGEFPLRLASRLPESMVVNYSKPAAVPAVEHLSFPACLMARWEVGVQRPELEGCSEAGLGKPNRAAILVRQCFSLLDPEEYQVEADHSKCHAPLGCISTLDLAFHDLDLGEAMGPFGSLLGSRQRDGPRLGHPGWISPRVVQ